MHAMNTSTSATPPLSARHEAFAVLCSGGLAAGAAYARIYPKASKVTAETEGPALLRKAQVKSRVAQLQATVEKEFTLTRVEWLASFARVAKKAESAGDFGAARGCLRELGLAMPGWYSSEKHDVNVSTPGLAELLRRVVQRGRPQEVKPEKSQSQ